MSPASPDQAVDSIIKPETHYLPPTPFCPNNALPILHYRSVLPTPCTEESTTNFLEKNGSWKKGGTWGHIGIRHFHPNTHECYGVFEGSSTILLGLGSGDTYPVDETETGTEKSTGKSKGLEIKLQAGDVIILPAGTGHCNLGSSEGYMYVGLYPSNAPPYRFDLGNEESDISTLEKEVKSVLLPEGDPVLSSEEEGLVGVWGNVARE